MSAHGKPSPDKRPPAPRPAAGSFPWERVALAARLLVGAVFIFSGLHKLAVPAEEFGAVLESYYIVPDSHTMLFAHAVPWAELLTGVFLAAGLFARAAAAAAFLMLSTFILALVSTKLRGIPLENCGCFGPGFHETRRQAVMLDSFLLLLAAAAFRHGGRPFSLDNWADSGE